MQIGGIDTPFEQCSADSVSVTSTGGTVAAIFTALTHTKGRGIMIQNRGSVDLLFGQATASAVWHVLPGSILTLYPKDLAKIFIKSSGVDVTVDAILVL